MVTDHRAVFDAIADPTRRAILDTLRRGERSAGEIADLFPVSRPAVSRHIRVLREAGLLTERRQSQLRFYSLNAKPLREVEAWLQHYRVFWTAKLQDLKSYVESRKAAPAGKETANDIHAPAHLDARRDP